MLHDDANTVNSLRVNERMLLWIILGGYFVLGAWYSLAVPAFETPDEIYHYAFARHLSQGQLAARPERRFYRPMGAGRQPGAPLLHACRWLTAGVDQTDFDEWLSLTRAPIWAIRSTRQQESHVVQQRTEAAPRLQPGLPHGPLAVAVHGRRHAVAGLSHGKLAFPAVPGCRYGCAAGGRHAAVHIHQRLFQQRQHGRCRYPLPCSTGWRACCPRAGAGRCRLGSGYPGVCLAWLR